MSKKRRRENGEKYCRITALEKERQMKIVSRSIGVRRVYWKMESKSLSLPQCISLVYMFTEEEEEEDEEESLSL